MVLRMVFWLAVLVLLLPTDERQQARLYEGARAAVEGMTTFCDRNPKLCEVGSDAWAAVRSKAEFAGRMANDIAARSGAWEAEAPAVQSQPVPAKARVEFRPVAPTRGTLTPADLSPPWRGQGQRTGT
jgi:hypothetical protein